MQARFSIAILATLLSCGSFEFEARATESFHVPAAGVGALECETHNGHIDISGDAARDSVEVTALKTVRATTQAIADTALRELEIVREIVDGTLHLRLRTQRTSTWEASVNFTVVAPSHIATSLETHNGSIKVARIGTTVTAASHNGGIHVDGDYQHIDLSTHNGNVRADLRGAGAIGGDIRTHNGSIVVELATAYSARIEATTHNGAMRTRAPVEAVEATEHALRARIGAGAGHLRIGTHNGNLRIGGPETGGRAKF